MEYGDQLIHCHGPQPGYTHGRTHRGANTEHNPQNPSTQTHRPTHKHTNPQTHKPTSPQTLPHTPKHKPTSPQCPQTHKRTNPQTHNPTNQQTHIPQHPSRAHTQMQGIGICRKDKNKGALGSKSLQTEIFLQTIINRDHLFRDPPVHPHRFLGPCELMGSRSHWATTSDP
jgi:hypothetical protein